MALNVSCCFFKLLILKGLNFFVKLCYNVIKKPATLPETSKIVPLSRGNSKSLKRSIMLNSN